MGEEQQMTSFLKRVDRFFAVLLALCLLAALPPVEALAANAAEYETYQTANGGFLRVNRFTNTLDGAVNIKGDLQIPSMIEQTQVKYIADGLFYGCDEMTSVTVPKSVETIGDRAFGACTSLKTVKLEEGLVSLGKDAFRYCYSLTDVSLPSTLTAIEGYSFASCLALKSVTVPSGVTRMGSYAFADCKNLTTVTLPDGITEMGDYAFSGCEKLTGAHLPQNLKSIPTALFDSCAALKDVTVGNQVTSIGQNAFGGCTSLEKLVLPEGVQRIDKWAFNGCKALKTLSVPDSVTSISADAFYGCDSITLYVNAGTLAQVFASANKIPFKLGTLDGSNPNPPDTYPETPFTDVQNHWAKSYVEWAYAKKYFAGVTTTTFVPNSPVNRGMLTSVLYRMDGSPDAGSSSFSDVSSKSYYAPAVAWGEKNKIVSGMGGGKFMPGRNITREQLAAMLFRYAQYKGLDTSKRGDLSGYKDTSSISSFAGTAMAWAVGEGIINGMDSTTLSPKGNATRAQTAVMLKKFSELS